MPWKFITNEDEISKASEDLYENLNATFLGIVAMFENHQFHDNASELNFICQVKINEINEKLNENFRWINIVKNKK